MSKLLALLVIFGLLAVGLTSSSGATAEGETSGTGETSATGESNPADFEPTKSVDKASIPADTILAGTIGVLDIPKGATEYFNKKFMVHKYDLFPTGRSFLHVKYCYKKAHEITARFYTGAGPSVSETAADTSLDKCGTAQVEVLPTDDLSVARLNLELQFKSCSCLNEVTVTLSAWISDSAVGGTINTPVLIPGVTSIAVPVPQNQFGEFRFLADQKVTNFVITGGALAKFQAFVSPKGKQVTAINPASPPTGVLKFPAIDLDQLKVGKLCTGDIAQFVSADENKVSYLYVLSAAGDNQDVSVLYRTDGSCSDSATTASALAALVVVVAKYFF